MDHARSLTLLDDFVADGVTTFYFEEAVRRAGRSRTATANLLHRLTERGLLDRVRRGCYAIRQLGVLGTTAAAESIALAVGAAFAGGLHRIAYRSALDEHDLTSHASRTIQVAVTRQSRIRSAKLSDRPLRLVLEPEAAIRLGATPRDPSWMSDLDRALVDACARPEVAGGASVLAEAITAAGRRADPEQLRRYAQELGWAAALRRLGSVADALEVDGIAGRLRPILTPRGDINLEPGTTNQTAWRDPKWRVLWPASPQELANVARQ